MFFRYRLHRVRLYYFNINKFFLFSILLFMGSLLLVFPLRGSCLQLAFAVLGGMDGDPTVILSQGLTGIETGYTRGNAGNPAPGTATVSPAVAKTPSAWSVVVTQLIRDLTGVDTTDAVAILYRELNVGQAAGTKEGVFHAWGGFPSRAAFTVQPEEGGEEDFYLPELEEDLEKWIVIPEDEFPPVQLHGEPMVLIYTTHNAESYKPSQGMAKLEGKNGGVAAVSSTFAKALESKHGIKTIYSDAIHDYPDFTKSYLNSMKTVKKYLQQYPRIQAVLDIHRDAGLKSRRDTLVKIQGKDCAKVMIVVGTEHPRYKENLAFAERLENKANELYPGLIKCVRLYKDRRYNQNLHTRALLLEFGSDLNKEEEAAEAAKLMADVLAAVLKQE